MKVLWFDTETTGLDPVKNDIVQIAGIIEIDGEVKKEFNFTCRPANPDNIEPEALETIGKTKDEIMSWPDPKSVYLELIQLFDKYINKYDKKDKFFPAGHNVLFDVKMFMEFARRHGDKYGIGSYMTWQPIDTMYIAVIMRQFTTFNPPNNKLEVICAEVGIKINAHDALSDVRASRDFGNCFLGTIKNCFR